MATIVGLSGSLRGGSFNTALLHAAVALAPEGPRDPAAHHPRHPALRRRQSRRRRAFRPSSARLKDAIAAADGLLMVTPEYNNSMPGVFKNAIDWLSRPDADIARVFARPAGRPDRRLARRVRHHPQPVRLAAGAAHARHQSVVRRPADADPAPAPPSTPRARSSTRRCASGSPAISRASPPSSTAAAAEAQVARGGRRGLDRRRSAAAGAGSRRRRGRARPPRSPARRAGTNSYSA